jgi:hypothetical protein
MQFIFQDTPFNQDISSWDTGRVGRFSDDDDQSNLHEGMRWMFRDATAFNQDLSKWCVQHVPDKPELFDEDAGFDGASSKHPDWGSSASC